MAGLYPEEVIQEVLSANNITDLIGSYVSLRRTGGGYMGLCPFHREKTPSFHVSEEKQLYHCFGCGVGGNAIHFVMAAENLDFIDSLKFLADRAGIALPEPEDSNRESQRYEMKKKMYEANVEFARFFFNMLYSDEGKTAMEYVKKRCLTDSTIKHFGVGYAPEGGKLLRFIEENKIGMDIAMNLGVIMKSERGNYIERFRNRLMIPIIDVRKNIIGFGGRALTKDAKAKYMNSPESQIFLKGRELFALNFAKNTADKRFILTEGYMDVISLHQAGFTGAIASMGTALTEEQARIIKKYASEVYICYDSDEAGQKATEAAMEIFAPLDIKVKILSLPEGKDPDEFIKNKGREAFGNVLTKARNMTDFRLFKLRDKYNIKDTDEKIEFTRLASLILCKVPNQIEREAYIKKLSEETGISEDSIMAEMMKNDYSLKKKEERKILTRPVLKNEQIQDKRENASPNVVSAERIILNLMVRNKSVYNKISGELSPEDYSTGTHRFLAQRIYKLREEGKEIDLPLLLSELPIENAGQGAAVFQDNEYNDDIKAAMDAIEIIDRVNFEQQRKKYVAENDIAKLNELIRKRTEKLRKEGQGT
ncbi:MAG: DNA primase [Bacillota bacterium]|nr:DNA primase [Bacillota bacterium]